MHVLIDDLQTNVDGMREGISSISDNKYGAQHLLKDRGISLTSGESTVVGFDLAVRISAKAVSVDGVSEATTVEEANKLLRSKKIDLFGNNVSEVVTAQPPSPPKTPCRSRG